MDFYKRPQSNTRRWLWPVAAAAGTLLLVFAPSGAWLNPPADAGPAAVLSAVFVKQLLTVALLLIVPAFISRATHTTGLPVLPVLGLLAFGFAYLLTRDIWSALCSLLLILLPGAGLYVLQKLQISNFRTVLYESVFVLFALFGYLCLKDLIVNGDAYLPFRSVIAAYQQLIEQLTPFVSGESGASVYESFLTELIGEAKLSPESIGLPALTVPAMCAGLSNVLFSHLFNRDGSAELVALPPFSEWRCERVFVFAATGFALVTYFLALAKVNGMDTLASIAMLVWRFPCALAGLSAARRLSLRTRKNWIFIVICVAAFVLPGFGMTLLPLLGMIASIGNRINDRKDGTMQ